MIMESINIWLYDRQHNKRRRVTLRVSSSQINRRKTEISTFVNFIHQRDANIAMSVVKNLHSYSLDKKESPFPLRRGRFGSFNLMS